MSARYFIQKRTNSIENVEAEQHVPFKLMISLIVLVGCFEDQKLRRGTKTQQQTRVCDSGVSREVQGINHHGVSRGRGSGRWRKGAQSDTYQDWEEWKTRKTGEEKVVEEVSVLRRGGVRC